MRGFTLVELLIAALIFLAVMGALLASLMIGKSSYLSSEAYIRVQQEARRALNAMTAEVREAGHIDSPTTGDNQDVTNTTRLNFKIAKSYDLSDPNCLGICWGNDTETGGWVHYLLNTGDPNHVQLARCQSTAAEGADTAITDFSACRVLANDVDTFSIDYADGTRTLTIRLANRATSGQLAGGSLSTTPAPLTTRIQLRNDS